MAVKAGTAYVDIEGDFSGLNRQVSSHFGRLTKDAGGAGKKVGRALGVGMVAGVGAAVVAGKQLFDFGKESVNVASDINESLSKNQVLFGKYAKGIESFSQRSANAFGISRQSALEYTGTFGNLFNALGISNKESAKFSTGLVKLSADMASFNNSTPEEALEAIRSGLVGETEPLRRFGVNMNDATLKAQAMRMGLIKNTKEALTPQTKALAAQALITKQTSAAHGDFARTSDQLANRQRRLQARWSDMKAELGTALLPAVNNISGALLDLADKVQPKVERSIKRITAIFGRKDLDFGEKLKRSWAVLERQFGPMVDGMIQKVREANLDDKLGELIRDASPKIAEGLKAVGIAGAKALWTGFKEAPLWAQVLGAGFVAKAIFGGTGGGAGGDLSSKTGPFGLAGSLAAKGFKTAFEAGAIRLSTLSGALGKVATIFTARGSTPANPIFVKDIAIGGAPGLPGKGKPGAPIPVPGGKPPGGGGAWNWIKSTVGKLPKGVRWAGGGILLPVSGYLTFRELVNSQRGGNELPKLVRDLDALVGAGTQGNPREEQLKKILKQLDKATGEKNAQGVRDSAKAMDDWAEANPNDSRADQLGRIADEARRLATTIKNNKTPIDNFSTSLNKNDIGIRRWAGDIASAKGKLKGLTKGSAEHESRLKTLRRTQRGMNDALIDMLPVTDDAKAEVRKLGINFWNLGGNVGETASYIAAATNQVLSGLDADTIKFSLKQSKRLKDYSRPGPFGGKQRGGPINGSGNGDKYPALLEAGEYVVNRKAVKKVGKPALDRLNFGDAPRFQRGGIVELLHPFNDPEGHGGSNSHLHIAMSTVAGIVALGKKLQRLGWLVGENPAFGGIQGNHAETGYHPRGLAIDVNWPDAGAEASKIRAILPMLGGSLGDLAAVVPKIPRMLIDGPAGMMKDILVGSERKMRRAAQAYVDKVGPTEGAEPGRGGEFGKAALKSLWIQAGGPPEVANIAAAIAMAESGGDPNIEGPLTRYGFRAKGLWQIHPPEPGSENPLTNARQAVRKYRASGFQPWEAYTNGSYRQFLQQGGLVNSLMSYFQPGGPVGQTAKKDVKKKGAKAPTKWFEKLKHHKSHKPKAHKTAAMLTKLGNAGIAGQSLQKIMDQLESNVDLYADWAQRANDITDTDALQSALNSELTLRGGRSNMSEAELEKLFPPMEQDAFIQQWLRSNASFNGGIQVDWLTAELSNLLAWRNTLIDNPPIFQALLKEARDAYAKVKKELARIARDIVMYQNKREAAVERRQNHQEKINELRRELEKEEEKKGSKRRPKVIADLRERLEDRRKKRDNANDDIEVYNKKLDILRGARGRARKQAQELGGDNGEPGDRGDGDTGRIARYTDSITAMETSLVDVHGLGTTMQKFVAPSQFQLGTLGGTILNVQNEILGISRNPPRASADVEGVDTTAAEEETKEILAQLLREANLRTAVSSAQFDVFRNLPTTFGNYPFGGFFQEGGPVPGPVGAPRMIVAHGGEYVIPNDGAGMAPRVTIHVASGMEWLKQFIDVRVEGQTRAQGRRGERQLPGRAGLLTR